MTPEEFETIQRKIKLTDSGMAAELRLADARQIRRYRAGDRTISGPVVRLMELFRDGVIKPDPERLKTGKMNDLR